MSGVSARMMVGRGNFYSEEETYKYAKNIGDFFSTLKHREARRIITLVGTGDICDFLGQTLVSGAVAFHYGTAFNLAVWRPDDPRKRFLLDCNPWIHGDMEVDADAETMLPVDWLDLGKYAPVNCQEPFWRERKLNRQDLVLLPSQTRGDLARSPLLRDDGFRFRLPEEAAEATGRRLARRGLDPRDGHLCIAFEGDRRAAGGPPAEASNDADILERLTRRAAGAGILLVLLSGLGDDAPPDGTIDLRDAPFDEKVAAIATARHFAGRIGWPLLAASAFAVPAIAFDALHYARYLWRDGDIVLPPVFRDPAGHVLDALEVFDRGLLEEGAPAWEGTLESTSPEAIGTALAAVDAAPPRPAAGAKPREHATLRFPLQWDAPVRLRFGTAGLSSNRPKKARPRRPVIVAFLGHQAVGDFIQLNIGAAAIAQSFPECELMLVFRNDRPYKAFLAALNPLATSLMAVSPDPRHVVPFELFMDEEAAAPASLGLGPGREAFRRPDLFLAPWTCHIEVGTHLGPVPPFRIPDGMAKVLDNGLRMRGLDPNRWFVVFHVREGNFVFRRNVSNRNRSADLGAYVPMIEDVIRGLGGQVVRIGDPSMTPLPAMTGFVDLALEPNSFELQVYAVSRARYFMASDSGPVMFGGMFATPTIKANAVNKGVQHRHDIVVPKWIVGPDGRRHDPRLLERMGAYSQVMSYIGDDHVYAALGAEDIVEASRFMHSRTTDTAGWRRPANPVARGPGYADIPYPRDFDRKLEVWTHFEDAATVPEP